MSFIERMKSRGPGIDPSGLVWDLGRSVYNVVAM